LLELHQFHIDDIKAFRRLGQEFREEIVHRRTALSRIKLGIGTQYLGIQSSAEFEQKGLPFG
jgi:hypothetical protein